MRVRVQTQWEKDITCQEWSVTNKYEAKFGAIDTVRGITWLAAIETPANKELNIITMHHEYKHFHM